MAVASWAVEHEDAHLHSSVSTLCSPREFCHRWPVGLGVCAVASETNLQEVMVDGMNGGNAHLAKSKLKHDKSCLFGFQIAPQLLVPCEGCAPLFLHRSFHCVGPVPLILVSDREDF